MHQLIKNMPQPSSCCCGCSVKTGTKIIGWLNLIPAALLLVATIVIGPIMYCTGPPDSPNRSFYVAVPVFLGIIASLACGLATILLIGAYQKKASLLRAWIVIVLILMGIRLVGITILGPHGVPNVFIQQFISLCIDTYSLMVVNSYYQELRDIPHNSLDELVDA